MIMNLSNASLIIIKIVFAQVFAQVFANSLKIVMSSSSSSSNDYEDDSIIAPSPFSSSTVTVLPLTYLNKWLMDGPVQFEGKIWTDYDDNFSVVDCDLFAWAQEVENSKEKGDEEEEKEKEELAVDTMDKRVIAWLHGESWYPEDGEWIMELLPNYEWIGTLGWAFCPSHSIIHPHMQSDSFLSKTLLGVWEPMTPIQWRNEIDKNPAYSFFLDSKGKITEYMFDDGEFAKLEYICGDRYETVDNFLLEKFTKSEILG